MASTIRCSSSPWGKDEGARLPPSLCSGETDTGWGKPDGIPPSLFWESDVGTWYVVRPLTSHYHHARFPALRLPLPRPLPPLSSLPPSPPPSLALCPPPPALTLARRVEGVCYFLASPDGASSPHAAKFKSAIQMIVDKVEKMQQPDGYMDIYFTVVDPEGRFQNLRDMHEMCQCSLFLGLCNRWLYLADGT